MRIRRREDQQVHVFGHDDPCPQIEAAGPPALLEGVEEPARGALSAEEGLTAEAGEGQVVSVALNVVSLAALAVSPGDGHAGIVR